MKIAVAGGTGVAGRLVVEELRERGQDTVTLSRAAGVDLLTGAGLDDALTGVDAIVDASNVTTMSRAVSVDFFERAGRNLAAAARKAGVRHLVSLSIVGVDRVRNPYYAGKLRQEEIVRDGSVPWTILRATQFHEFAAQIYQRAAIGPVHLAPRMRTQPVAAAEVGARLVELAGAGPAGRVRDLAGPREESLVRMVRAYAHARGSRAWIPAIPLPGAGGRAQRDGSLLPTGDAQLGRQTFDEWLAAHTVAR